MVATSDVKFYKSTGSGLGGAINTAAPITTNQSDNSFPDVTRAEQVTGKDYYLCIYIKNTHATEEMKAVSFWLTQQSGGQDHDTETKWAKDAAGLNGTAQTIVNINTSPTSVSWNSFTPSEPSTANIGLLKAGEYFPLWIWRHIDANAVSRHDDGPLFAFALNIPSGGTGGGSGTGGEPDAILDIFGIKQFYKTKLNGKVWTSVLWNNAHVRSLAQDQFDPDDPELGYHRGSGAATMDIDGAGMATFATLSTSHRVFVNGPWLNTEETVYARIRTDASSIQLRSRNNHHGVQDLPYGLESTSPEISCGFGTYEVAWLPHQSIAQNEVEVIHDLYVRELDRKSIAPIANNVWVGYKQITRTVNNTVVVQGWTNRDITKQSVWIKETEFTYTGTNVHVDPTGHEINVSTCINKGDHVSGDLDKNTLWLQGSKWCWIRINDGDDVDLKFYSIREIDPNTLTGGSVGGDTGGGSGTGGGGGGNPPPVNANWKMAVAGDWGCGSTTNAVINLCKKYDFTLGVGDNAYAAASCWTSAFGVLKPKLNSAYGNHEYSESGGISPYKTFFGHSKTYFSFNFQNVHVIVLDSNINMDAGSAQNDFAVADLTAADANPDIDWIFATTHHPWFGSSSSHSYNNGNEVNAFHSLFQTHKVAFVFTGHNHNWQCSKQVAYNAGSPTNPTVFNGTPPFVKTASGLIHVVTGTGGHDSGGSLYSLGSQPSFQLYQNRTNNGIFEIVASENAQKLTCSFVNTDGNKFNPFVITST